MTTPEHRIADVFRVMALRLEDALERGNRTRRLDANDLLQTLLSIADELDPPVASEPDGQPGLLEAARALLEAREDEMVTSQEWDRLQRAVDAATPR